MQKAGMARVIRRVEWPLAILLFNLGSGDVFNAVIGTCLAVFSLRVTAWFLENYDVT